MDDPPDPDSDRLEPPVVFYGLFPRWAGPSGEEGWELRWAGEAAEHEPDLRALSV